ncbi:hypothetical protein T36_1310 [Helicobacter cinaedi]|uniref:hypothetical protein n=1 Tax=Helicobacter cinaedi TaxID=213 RepID=UPI001F3640DD|nr:hypothetical protein [Helicobacter cinaedi]BDB64853.1 hypothetical protein T36_1310 [Helicobacter cinaedi]
MKNLLIGSLSLAAILAFSGCGSEPKSLEELQKLSKDELKKMNKACKAVISPATSKLGENASEIDLEKADASDSKLNKDREKIANDILQARGLQPKTYGLMGTPLSMVVVDFTNEEVSKFGNSDFAEYVECARIRKALSK